MLLLVSTDRIAPKRPATTRVAVVGAGMPGLATAWFLQEHGVQVTVFDRVGVAGGSTWGNAGWISPALTAPLPEPAVLRYGLRAILDPSSPVYVPPRLDARLMRFLVGFARNSTAARWRHGVGVYSPLVDRAMDAFDTLTSAGVRATSFRRTPILAAARSERELAGLVHELEAVRDLGRNIAWDALSGDELRKLEPALSGAVEVGLRILDQGSIDPGEFADALGASVVERGGVLRAPETVSRVTDTATHALVHLAGGTPEEFDSVVLATGAWVSALARPFGVRRGVSAGRGYSFSVAFDAPLSHPVYFPSQRVACSPLEGRVRLAGTMEMVPPDKPLSAKRVAAIAGSVAPLLDGVDLSSRSEVWVGSRPCTSDGLPLIGATGSPRVFVNGGHGMWGVTLGPVSGRLLADHMVTGRPHASLHPFAPTR
jgi:D-amino-acid dehydrogenase